ncbi:hypothetical protein [Mycobacterium sp.]|uniref:hypothetical protein n=1 Tax=Mycobacterium sp. TaxID=1785 RepID=UPI003BAC344A
MTIYTSDETRPRAARRGPALMASLFEFTEPRIEHHQVDIADDRHPAPHHVAVTHGCVVGGGLR